ncbi:hypothetical protein AAHE18_08G004200 [Arachis hypogaea]
MEALVYEDSVVFLRYQVRSPEGHKKFCEMCDEVFDIEMAPRDHLHPEYVYEETGVFLLRKEKKKQ